MLKIGADFKCQPDAEQVCSHVSLFTSLCKCMCADGRVTVC